LDNVEIVDDDEDVDMADDVCDSAELSSVSSFS
jgi:hypothetical protein